MYILYKLYNYTQTKDLYIAHVIHSNSTATLWW